MEGPSEAGRQKPRGHPLHGRVGGRALEKAEPVLSPPQNILPSGQTPRSQGGLGRRVQKGSGTPSPAHPLTVPPHPCLNSKAHFLLVPILYLSSDIWVLGERAEASGTVLASWCSGRWPRGGGLWAFSNVSWPSADQVSGREPSGAQRVWGQLMVC